MESIRLRRHPAARGPNPARRPSKGWKDFIRRLEDFRLHFPDSGKIRRTFSEGWKNSFQRLEKTGVRFPDTGKNRAKVSRAWKKSFQGLENFGLRVPSIGKNTLPRQGSRNGEAAIAAAFPKAAAGDGIQRSEDRGRKTERWTNHGQGSQADSPPRKFSRGVNGRGAPGATLSRGSHERTVSLCRTVRFPPGGSQGRNPGSGCDGCASGVRPNPHWT
jgi:hypothetical protein